MSASASGPLASRAPVEPWLETIDTDSPLLLIAPHGGRAEPATRSMLNPKVNDLHTADITRELARRLDAAALINAGIDRNRLDCNRIQQLLARAPWLLEMIADRLEQIVERHGHAVVLLIHGWNIIEPRVDFGLGLRNIGGELHPPGTACVSACDEFIHGPLAHFAERLHEHGIRPSFGMRYPAGGLQNLVQAFTARHRDNPAEPLKRIAAIAGARTGRRGTARTCQWHSGCRERCVRDASTRSRRRSHPTDTRRRMTGSTGHRVPESS